VSRITGIELRLVSLPLVRPFRTSFGEETAKECILAGVRTEDVVGWGECVAGPRPDFSDEFNAAAWMALRDHLGPSILGRSIAPEDLADAFSHVRGNPMAKATLVMAVLDASLRERDASLAGYLGSSKGRVECGVSVGIAPTNEELQQQVAGYLAEGYRRIKLKIEPGLDVERVDAVRRAHPDIPLSVDANAAYSLSDAPIMKALDAFDLLMIEQPLRHDDLVDHAKLQRLVRTPICLDESIRSAADAAAALEIGACRVINIKQGRVGGLLEGRAIHELALAQGVPVWCGGMLETGLGRAANLALASLPGFTLPGDTSASRRYFAEDLTPPFEMDADGTMAVPDGPGLGVDPLPDRLEACTIRLERLSV
jgi:O-succinylbenzoate synthase